MKEPLTRAQLLAIQERGKSDPDVRALLWEVFRLRALALRTHDYVRQAPTSSTGHMLAERLQAELDEEPVVKEQPKKMGRHWFVKANAEYTPD
jgi:hypothetical protein